MDKKFILSIEPYEGHHAADYDFYVEAYTDASSPVRFEKDQLPVVDEDHFIVPVDLTAFRRGLLMFDLIAKVPDPTFESGVRNERITINSKYVV